VNYLNPNDYISNVYALPMFIVAVAITFLGLFILVREHGSHVGFSFLYMCLSVGLYLVATGANYLSRDESLSLIWIRISHLGVVFIPTTILLFTANYLSLTPRYRLTIASSIVLSTLFALGVLFTDLHIKGSAQFFWGRFVQYGPLGFVFMGFFVSIMIFVLRLYWLAYRQSSSERQKKRMRGLLIAFSGGYLGAVDFLPAFGLPVYPSGYLPICFFVAVNAYIILRYEFTDITPELAAERILETIQGAVIVIDLKGKIRVTSSVVGEMLGYQKSELIGSDIGTILPSLAEFNSTTLMSEKSSSHEMTWKSRNGQRFEVIISTSTITNPLNNSPVGIVYSAYDITERKNAEELLIRQNEIFIKGILESVDEGFVVVGRDYRIILANKAFCETAGMTIENVIGRHCYEVSHHNATPCFEAGEQCSVKRTFETGEHFACMHTHFDEHGHPLYVDTKSYAMRDASGNVTSVIEICVDVTEKRKLEDQYRQAQKMEAIGQLAGGVAHDFNNILSAIIGYGHLSLTKLPDDGPVKHYIDQILQSSERAAALTQSLLAFSRKQPRKIELQELNAVTKNFDKFLQRLLREDIEMTIRYSAERSMIMADRGQVEQVIMNLVTNARDAMPDKGKLTIDTTIISMDDSFIRSHGYGKVGDYVVLTVSDTGIGMNEETQKKIFEPFFTTKKMGKGTGLGLATVYGIVKAHDGFINVYSELGKGSVFHVYFPLARTTKVVPEPAAQNQVLLVGGSETILLAEDDSSLRNMTSIILRDMGYTVIEAEDGNRAAIQFIENHAAIKLVILDGIMPKMNGLETYRNISILSPKIRCIFMSGYSGEVFAQDGLPTNTAFLSKPIKPSELLSKVRETLDRE